MQAGSYSWFSIASVNETGMNDTRCCRRLFSNTIYSGSVERKPLKRLMEFDLVAIKNDALVFPEFSKETLE